VKFEIDAEIVAFGDERLVNVVLENLIGNALKFTKHRPETKIRVGYETANGERIYFIQDNGAGFDMNYVGKLFNPFSRLHTTDEFEGTGIGLATVHRVIARHGGRIWAESTLNVGTSLYFTLAAATGPRSDTSSEVRALANQSLSHSGASRA
jgi:light-regulated signal transduction histidine kinase (bacteriophytochrome)